MKAITRRSLVFLLIVIASLISIRAFAGVPVVSDIMVTDVTPVSFSVIWASSEESTANLEVFQDVLGATPVAGAVITPHPIESGNNSIKDAAEANGVMKVRVTGLEPNTSYYFKTITTSTTSDITLDPSTNPYLLVTTEADTVRAKDVSGDMIPYCNDVIVQACYLADGTTAATGTLLLATVKGGNYPVTAFVGDGVVLPYALIDLNNFYSSDTFENLDLLQGENLTLLNFRGTAGNSIITHNVPLDVSLNEIKPGESALKPGWNLVSTQLEPGNTDLETVLGPIWNEFISAWSYDNSLDSWFQFEKTPEFSWTNNLTDINSLTGYWMFVDNETSLPVNGSLVSDVPVSLYTGWNLVAYSAIETKDLTDAIDPISSYLISIWTYDTGQDVWFQYETNPEFSWTNNLYHIEPGKAYWIDVSQNCSW